MHDDGWTTVREAWHTALYGEEGFYRREWPADHFRTSAQASASFAGALHLLVRRHGLSQVCDIGCGGGELLAQLHRLDPSLGLTGIEIRPRPQGLPPGAEWRSALPMGLSGLVFANELLDNIPCDIVEVDDRGTRRQVEVDPETAVERLGDPTTNEQEEWLRTWWPIDEPGQRAEVGILRDDFWAMVCMANPAALCVAVDYGHLAEDRPPFGSLTSYRRGVQRPVSYDGGHDITAHVAVDSVAVAIGASVRGQRDVLGELGIDGMRPPIELATTDPAGYVRTLSAATERAELTATGGLGDFCWVCRPPVTGE